MSPVGANKHGGSIAAAAAAARSACTGVGPVLAAPEPIGALNRHTQAAAAAAAGSSRNADASSSTAAAAVSDDDAGVDRGSGVPPASRDLAAAAAPASCHLRLALHDPALPPTHLAATAHCTARCVPGLLPPQHHPHTPLP